ncbi:hypothetical protein MKZ38_009896 [Zalerion maritima]|uniref:Uncharacterized protein n=1 Tax=Zalerion maritima TaxID=339359 RepID=A0AAD5WM71_9PEZI|nr:hypothetical protein MKZ38_009896 [Zalerion maritima]
MAGVRGKARPRRRRRRYRHNFSDLHEAAVERLFSPKPAAPQAVGALEPSVALCPPTSPDASPNRTVTQAMCNVTSPRPRDSSSSQQDADLNKPPSLPQGTIDENNDMLPRSEPPLSPSSKTSTVPPDILCLGKVHVTTLTTQGVQTVAQGPWSHNVMTRKLAEELKAPIFLEPPTRGGLSRVKGVVVFQSEYWTQVIVSVLMGEFEPRIMNFKIWDGEMPQSNIGLFITTNRLFDSHESPIPAPLAASRQGLTQTTNWEQNAQAGASDVDGGNGNGNVEIPTIDNAEPKANQADLLHRAHPAVVQAQVPIAQPALPAPAKYAGNPGPALPATPMEPNLDKYCKCCRERCNGSG